MKVLAPLLLVAPAFAQVTQRVSVSTAELEGNAGGNTASISSDGRFVVFLSASSNLVPGDTNGTDDVFVRNMHTGTTQRVSVDSFEVQGNGWCWSAAISSDGRYVVFQSDSTNLVPGDTNQVDDVFLRDRLNGTTERINISSTGAQSNSWSYGGSFSTDSRYVAFTSMSDNFAPGFGIGMNIFVRDRHLGITEVVSVSVAGGQPNGDSFGAVISGNGRYVAFASTASNLVPGDVNGVPDVFVRDRVLGVTLRASVGPGGIEGNGQSNTPSMSRNGRYVAFQSQAANFYASDANGATDVFVRDLVTGTTSCASLNASGFTGARESNVPSISTGGDFVSFHSVAEDLVPGDTNSLYDVFVRNMATGITSRVSLSTSGAQGDSYSFWSSCSGDGRFVCFTSNATNLVSGDTNAAQDVFVHDRNASGFVNVCEPGTGGVLACPCGNPPGGPLRGCDNSSATGGAALTASGLAYLAQDSLTFTASGEKPSALSVVFQGPTGVAGGVQFGQGVLCLGGTLKRMYAKQAVAGSIVAPSGSEPAVSERSAALGDVIQAGESRWYAVAYRDSNVLGGCATGSTFNVTQTGVVGWSL